MKHVHYDLDRIEAGTRRMYAEAAPSDLSDSPAIAAIFKRSVEVEVQMQRFILSEIMAGTAPSDLLQAFELALVNLLLNHAMHFTPLDGGCVICGILQRVVDGVSSNHQDGVPTSGSSAFVDVSPVTSGTA